jgi:hypothetical protein|tara:strand:+ start:65 stop:268 length:204 start_codon:yes stop_codon:yes gene_type:complete
LKAGAYCINEFSFGFSTFLFFFSRSRTAWGIFVLTSPFCCTSVVSAYPPSAKLSGAETPALTGATGI